MKLLSYDGESVEIDIDLDDPSILAASVNVISGDEVLSVLYRDGSESEYDACYLAGMWRASDHHDGSYPVVINGKWCVDKDAFLSRKDSYWNAYWRHDD